MSNKDFSQSQRETIWRKYNGYNNTAIDPFGMRMTIHDFECDHIWPKSLGGLTIVENGQPLSAYSNKEKSDNTYGVINGKKFEVNRNSVMYVNGVKVTK